MTARPWTPDRRNEAGTGRIITTKRACNGCGRLLGDVSLIEIRAGMSGQELPDVRGECPDCCPVHATGPADAFKGPVKDPTCRQGHLLADCECWRNNRTEERG